MLSKEAVGIILLVTGILAYMLQGQLGTTEVDNASLLFWVIAGLVLFIEGIDAELKYHSPKIVLPITGYTLTYSSNDVMKIGDWYIIRLGGVQAYGFYFPGNDGTIIVHKSAVNFVGDSIVITAVPEVLLDDREMPPEIRANLIELGLPEPYMFAAQPSKDLKHPDINAINQKIRVYAKMLNEFIEVAKGHIGAVEDVVSQADRINTLRKGFLQQLLDKITKDKEETKTAAQVPRT